MVGKINRNVSKLAVFFSIAALGLTGCQKKRSEKFKQGEGEYVYELSEFKDKIYDVETGAFVAPPVAVDADNLITDGDDQQAVIRSFDAVEFSSEIDIFEFNSDTLETLKFYAEKNTTEKYKAQIGFTENHLIVYKVAKIEDLPTDEMTYAIVDGESAKVPVLGYPLTKYVIEKVKDVRDKDTRQKTTIEKKKLAESTHFSIDQAKPQFFESADKLNMIPADFFNGEDEWFYEISLVDTPLNAHVGAQLDAGKSKFYRTSNTISVVDVNIPPEAAELSSEKLPRVLTLPVFWADYQLKKSGEDAFLKEVLNVEKEGGTLSWTDREYALIDFKRAIDADTANTNEYRVTRLEINEDYFSFILAIASDGTSIHFSFAKDKAKIKGQVYPELDTKKFGFWRAIKEFYPGQSTSAEQFLAKNQFLSRMYPEGADIDVYLTENTPDDPVFVQAIADAMNAWDKAFVEAARGSSREANPIRIRLKTDKRVTPGDVRYNKISFYDFNINVGGLLGYGPSVADGRNGHIYSSTNHIYLRTYREGIYRNLKTYIRHRLGLFDDKTVQGVDFPNQILRVASTVDTDFDALAAGTAGFVPYRWENATLVRNERPASANGSVGSAPTRDYFDAIVAGKTSHEGLYSPILESAIASRAVTAESKISKIMNTQDHSKHNCGYMAAKANTFKEIEDICGGLDFGRYVEELVASKDSLNLETLDYPIETFDACAIQLLKPTLTSTLVHEFGHNLGLTHNFKGSTDYKNFEFDENGVPVVRSTSAMDYPDRDSDRGVKPGPYDVAAIRYGYYRTVELNNSNDQSQVDIVRIEAADREDTRPIEQRVEAQGIDPALLKDYKYCWDYDIIGPEVPMETPDCRRWDRGSNPVQMAYAIMDQFNSTIATGLNRFEEANLWSPEGFVDTQIMLPLKAIYTRYRYLLSLKTRGLNDPYFIRTEGNFDAFVAANVGEADYTKLPEDERELEQYLEARNEDGSYKVSELQQYKMASDIIFKFLRQVSLSQDRYCTFWDVDGDKETIIGAEPFATLRLEAFNSMSNGGRSSDSRLLNCSEIIEQTDTETELNFAKKVAGTLEVRDFGKSYDDIAFSPDQQAIQEKPRVTAGFGVYRGFAFQALTGRFAPLGIALMNDFAPSFLDNPNYRKQLMDDLMVRLTEGVNLNELIAKKNQSSAQDVNRFIREFSEEQDLLAFMFGMVQANIGAPYENSFQRTSTVRPRIDYLDTFNARYPTEASREDVRSIEDGVSGQVYYSDMVGSPIWRLLDQFKQVSVMFERRANYGLLTDFGDILKENTIAIAKIVKDSVGETVVTPDLARKVAMDAAIAELSSQYLPAADEPEATEGEASSDEAEESSDEEAASEPAAAPLSALAKQYIEQVVPILDQLVEAGQVVDYVTIYMAVAEVAGNPTTFEKDFDYAISEVVSDAQTAQIYSSFVELFLEQQAGNGETELSDEDAWKKVEKTLKAADFDEDVANEIEAQINMIQGIILR